MHLSSRVQTLRKRCVHSLVHRAVGEDLCITVKSCCNVMLFHVVFPSSSSLTTSCPLLPLPPPVPPPPPHLPPPPPQNERHYIMQVVCEATQCVEEPRVRRGTWGEDVLPVLPLAVGADIVCACVRACLHVYVCVYVCVLCGCRYEWPHSRTWFGS